MQITHGLQLVEAHSLQLCFLPQQLEVIDNAAKSLQASLSLNHVSSCALSQVVNSPQLPPIEQQKGASNGGTCEVEAVGMGASSRELRTP